MKTIQQAMLEQIYTEAIEIAHGRKFGEKQAIHDVKSAIDGEYFVTLRQLEDILKEFEG